MVRLADVAELAQVSVATVSKIINRAKGWESYSDACVVRVRRAARELGYRPNYHARSLQAGLAHALGMVALPPDADGDWGAFWGGVVAGADAEVLSSGQQFVVIGPSGGVSAIDRALGFWQERRIDAVIAPSFVREVHPDAFARADAPIVLMGPAPGTDLPAVELDDAAGIGEAVGHLCALGHRQFVWFGPDDPSGGAVSCRREACEFHAAQAGCTVSCVAIPVSSGGSSAWTDGAVSRSRERLVEAWRSGVRGTALVCYDEATAFGAYAALAELGLGIPRDVSVVGFDDIHACMAYPAMTVVSHMLGQIGRRAARLALEMVGDRERWESLRGYRERIRPRLMIRGSTGPVSPGARSECVGETNGMA